jgi:hypothetical protein
MGNEGGRAALLKSIGVDRRGGFFAFAPKTMTGGGFSA